MSYELDVTRIDYESNNQLYSLAYKWLENSYEVEIIWHHYHHLNVESWEITVKDHAGIERERRGSMTAEEANIFIQQVSAYADSHTLYS